MAVKPIRDAADYEAAIRRLTKLADAKVGTSLGDEADVLSTLVDLYEKQNDPIELPTALEAIKFRMDQRKLTPRDLIPDIGTKSRVSEVLSGQRPLTVDMIRSLHKRWDIPLEALIKLDEFERIARPEPPKPVLKKLEALKIMKRGEEFAAFRSRVCGQHMKGELQAAYRRRTTPSADLVALDAWCVGVMARSVDLPVRTESIGTSFKTTFLHDLARLSIRPNGALLVRDWLADAGICFVIMPHLPSTHLDGAALVRDDGVPIVALTLRHDRIDNFWFTLLHECAHVVLKHVRIGQAPIIDDLEVSPDEVMEQEADDSALEALVPRSIWDRFSANEYTSTAEVVDTAHEAGVHPAIVAGMWRREQKNYRKFSSLLGHGSIRKLFGSELGEAV